MRRDRVSSPLALLLSLAGACAGAHATVYTVKNTLDSGTDSLRAAITAANAAGGTNTIQFAIPGSGPFKITLASQLPLIKNTLTIDGYTQAGSVFNSHAPDEGGIQATLMIEIDGNGQSYGFAVDNGTVNLTVQGLALHGFGSAAINGNGGASGTSQINVYGNYIGTAIDGSALPSLGNGGSAVACGLSNCQVGGTQSWQRNVLSGNGYAGVYLVATGIIEGNLIGTDASGTIAIPNGMPSNWPGINLHASVAGIRVGCTGLGCASAASRNVISGNWIHGIGIWDGSGANTGGAEIKGNYIGTDWSGTKPLPNGYGGAPNCPNFCAAIELQGVASAKPATIIGGFGAGEANLIAFNQGAGLAVYPLQDFVGASFDSRGNAIHHNRGVGRLNIDIKTLGPTPDDAGDVDAGQNLGQNRPQIISASQSGDTLTVTYLVDTAVANATFPLRVDFYADVIGGSGELLAEDFYPASSAQLQRTIGLAVPHGVSAIPFVATATDADGHTSEFAAAYDVIFEDDCE